MNENLYKFYTNKLIKKSRNNPLYQYSVLIFFNQGILWDIEKYKKSELFSYINDKPINRTEKRVYVGIGGRKKMIIEHVKPYLRRVDYFSTLAPLLSFFPELTPPIVQEEEF